MSTNCASLLRWVVNHRRILDNGKVFTARFGSGVGEVLFDRICRENGVRHLLTAPRSPTTTGKVERFHKTLRGELLAGRSFASQDEAQTALDAWVELYNSERPHQGIGMVVPAQRFALADAERLAPVALAAEGEQPPPEAPVVPDHRFTRRVGAKGHISFESHSYHVGTWLAGQTVDLTLRDGLLEVSHRGVLVACHARRHCQTPMRTSPQRPPRARAARPQTSGRPVLRKVDGSGAVCFAGTAYCVGNAYRRQQVEVRIVGDSVEISRDGRLLKTHAARHDRDKEHGAFSTPQGRPRRRKAVALSDGGGGTEVLEPRWNAGGET
jgi:hypothetical protein